MILSNYEYCNVFLHSVKEHPNEFSNHYPAMWILIYSNKSNKKKDVCSKNTSTRKLVDIEWFINGNSLIIPSSSVSDASADVVQRSFDVWRCWREPAEFAGIPLQRHRCAFEKLCPSIIYIDLFIDNKTFLEWRMNRITVKLISSMDEPFWTVVSSLRLTQNVCSGAAAAEIWMNLERILKGFGIIRS